MARGTARRAGSSRRQIRLRLTSTSGTVCRMARAGRASARNSTTACGQPLVTRPFLPSGMLPEQDRLLLRQTWLRGSGRSLVVQTGGGEIRADIPSHSSRCHGHNLQEHPVRSSRDPGSARKALRRLRPEGRHSGHEAEPHRGTLLTVIGHSIAVTDRMQPFPPVRTPHALPVCQPAGRSRTGQPPEPGCPQCDGRAHLPVSLTTGLPGEAAASHPGLPAERE